MPRPTRVLDGAAAPPDPRPRLRPRRRHASRGPPRDRGRCDADSEDHRWVHDGGLHRRCLAVRRPGQARRPCRIGRRRLPLARRDRLASPSDPRRHGRRRLQRDNPGEQALTVKGYILEAGDTFTVSADKLSVTYRFKNYGRLDGLDFTTACATRLGVSGRMKRRPPPGPPDLGRPGWPPSAREPVRDPAPGLAQTRASQPGGPRPPGFSVSGRLLPLHEPLAETPNIDLRRRSDRRRCC